MSSVKEFSVEEKLTSLVTLQKVESKLDEYKILKGELPMEVSDLEDEITGFIVDGVDDAVHAVERAAAIDRRRVRAEFERRFTATRMAGDYVRVYEQLAAVRPPRRPQKAPARG